MWVSTALHHFGGIHQALDELGRVLDPGGRVLVRTYAPGRTEVTWVDEFPGRQKWQARFDTEPELVALFEAHGFDLVDIRDVLECTETYADSARWAARMRHADSMLTALTDEEIDAGLDALSSRPSKVGGWNSRCSCSGAVKRRHRGSCRRTARLAAPWSKPIA